VPEIGQTILHHRILEMIGAGGMGKVCLAGDLSLDRKAALDCLPDAFIECYEQIVFHGSYFCLNWAASMSTGKNHEEIPISAASCLSLLGGMR